jgi:hypothetical protein
MTIQIKNLKVRQKYKGINPVLLRKLNILDCNKILCDDLKKLICSYKFCLSHHKIISLKTNLNNYKHNTDKVIKIINKFIKNNITKQHLIINFEVYFNNYFLQIHNNRINLYYNDFEKMYSQSESESETESESSYNYENLYPKSESSDDFE